MSSKKDKLAKLFSVLGVNPAVKYFRSLVIRDLRIIAYHRICDVDDSNDRELVSASVAEFDWQVRHIREHYHALTFADAMQCLQERRDLPRNAIVITFDDGFYDNYANAFPVLKKHGIPATFFVSSGYIGSGETFWFNQVARMINGNPGKFFTVESRDFKLPEDIASRLELVPEVLNLLKQVPNQSRLDYLRDIARQLNHVDDCDALARPMNWEQVKEMSNNGCEIGSHTVSHPILTQISAQQLSREIHDSKKEIEARIGREIHSISYPEGMDYAYNKNVLNEVDEAGYAFGATYVPGNNYRPRVHDYLLRRGHIERYINRERFAAMLSLPEIFN